MGALGKRANNPSTEEELWAWWRSKPHSTSFGKICGPREGGALRASSHGWGGTKLQRRGLRLVVVSDHDGTAHEVRLPHGIQAFGLAAAMGVAVSLAVLLLLFAGYTNTQRTTAVQKARIAALSKRITHQKALAQAYTRDKQAAATLTQESSALPKAVAVAESSVGVKKTTAIPAPSNLGDVLTVLSEVSQVLPATTKDAYTQASYLGRDPGPYAFVWPMEGIVTSPFGMRVDPVIHVYQLHAGIDIGATIGRPIVAAAPGCVFFAGWQVGYGKVLFIHDPDGITTVYAHDSRFYVRDGQCVKQGQLIAAAGNTGWSTGPHLLFEIRWGGMNGNPVNPMPWLPPRPYRIVTPTLVTSIQLTETQVAASLHKLQSVMAHPAP